jgi:large subunit ribosomal protein L35
MPWLLLIATARNQLHLAPHGHKRKSEMSKMKTKSGAKKRFKITAKGKIKTHQVGKRHRLINNSPARTRDLRGMDTLSESETRRVKRWMPYGGGI